ncbi:MAG: FAD-dependent oxidoreductase [Thermodesulfovibrio sp.]|nr:FAD-dependent oxidoreductase [Thermodesulfovibrio sp.]
MRNLILKYFREFLISAERGIKEYLNNIDKDYYDFMDSHVKIIVQSSIERINFLILLLCLGYPFTGIGYSEEGMGRLIEAIAKDSDIYLKTEVKSIKRYNEGLIIKGDFGKEIFDRVILAYPVFEDMNTIEDENLKDYFRKYIHLITEELRKTMKNILYLQYLRIPELPIG